MTKINQKKKLVCAVKKAPRRDAVKAQTMSLAQEIRFRSTDAAILAKSQTMGWERLSSPIEVVAKTRDIAGANCGRLLRWKDDEGNAHECVVSAAELVSEPARVCARLVHEGLPYVSNRGRHKILLCRYLLQAAANRLLLLAKRTGWQGPTYVLSNGAISPDGKEDILYQSTTQSARWGTSGTLAQWRENIGRLCSGNSRLLFAASTALAGPLLALVDGESGGFHLHGVTSLGKTTTLFIAGSLLGGGGPNGFLQTWRATSNALEAIAESHNDATLLLDELGQVDPAEAANIAYMLANGLGRSRMNHNTAVRPSFQWQLFTLSTGEPTLAEHASAAGRRLRGGAGIRMLNISADAGCGLGIFENLHGFESADVFARHLKHNALRFYGRPFPKFVQMVVCNRDLIQEKALFYQDKFRRLHVPTEASGEVRRAADRFALVGFAGELATHARITGWVRNEAWRAAVRLFEEWRASANEGVPNEVEIAVARIRSLVVNDAARFTSGADDGTQVADHAGFIRMHQVTGGREFWLLPRVFQEEICDGISHETVARELVRRGHLRRHGDRLTSKQRVPGHANPIHVFCVRESILTDHGRTQLMADVPQ
jgi:putative DNA primase/helicase